MENPRRYSLKTFRTTFVTEEGAPDPAISNSREAASLARVIFSRDYDANQEHLMLFALNTKNRVYGFKVITSGSASMSIADPKMIFLTALKLEAQAFVLLHNHPSGDPTPSREDRELTKRVLIGSKIVGLKFLDHIVLGENDYFSFADAGDLRDEMLALIQ